MGVLHFLLVILATVMSVKAIDLCPFDGDWKYHDGTGTCMILNQTTQNYISARDICRNISGGPSRNKVGHLVIILDKDTDAVVKEMLKTASVDKALIGLSCNSTIRKCTWNETTQGLESYVGWATNHPLSVTDMNSVVITADGWKRFGTYAKAAFVCQVDAVVELPRIRCPLVAEVEQQFSNITCTMNVPAGQTGLSELRFTSAGEVVGSCSYNSCIGYEGYKASVAVYTQSWSSTLHINRVKRNDENDWRCSVRFNDGQEISSRPCYLHVYTLPATVDCKVNYLQDEVNVSCTAEQMYPKAGCLWNIEPYPNFTISPKNESPESIQYYDTNKVIHYRQVCSWSARGFKAGTYMLNVSVYPIILHQGKTQPTAYKTGNIRIILEPPQDPPVMYDSNDRPITSPLSVRESQRVTIKCQITGGTPAVYATVITCLSQSRSGLSRYFTSIDIAITPAFHNKSCHCYGKHVTGSSGITFVKFLVISPPNITSFTIDGRQSYEVWNNTAISMTCTTTGHPMPMLSIVYNHGEKTKLQSVDNSEITHKMQATCQAMGDYICLAENNDQQRDSTSVNLRVRCATEYCPRKEETPKFGISMGSNKTVKLCVIAYPAPTYFRLYTGIPNREVARLGYRVNFTYTDETSGRGEITVTIFSVGPQDFGSYLLYSSGLTSGNSHLHSDLKFELLAPAPPICPENLTVSVTLPGSITLSWKPGFDGGLQQSFTILRYDSGSTTEPQTVSVIPQPAGSLKAEMSYTVTGLSGSTTYTFGLRAENEGGFANCTLKIQGSTKASPLSSSDQNLTVIVVPVVLVLILVIIVVVVVVFVVVRRRRSRGVLKQGTAQASKAQASSSSRTDDHETSNTNAKLEHRPAAQGIFKVNNFSKGATEEVGQDNTYAQVVKENAKKAKGESRDKNIFKRNSDELKQDNTYALVNKPDKGKGQGKSNLKNPRQEDTVEAQQDDTYAQVVKENKKKGKKQKRTDGDEDNGAVMYANTSDYVTMNPRQGVADEVYANVAGSSKAREEKAGQARDDGRTVTEDGLIYAEVMSNAKLTSPESKGQARPKVAKLPPKVEEPGVEYMELDLVATARHK